MKLLERIGDLLSGRIEKTFDAIYLVLFDKQGLSRIDKLEKQLIMNTRDEQRLLDAAEAIKGFVPALKEFVENVKAKDAEKDRQIQELRQAVIKAPIPNPPVVAEEKISLDEEFAVFDGALADLGQTIQGLGSIGSSTSSEGGDMPTGSATTTTNDVAVGDGVADVPQKTPDYLAGQSGATNPVPGLDTETPNIQDQPGTSPNVETSPSSSETTENPQGQQGGEFLQDVTLDEGDEDLEDTEEVPANNEGVLPGGEAQPTGLAQEETAPPSFNDSDIQSTTVEAETKQPDENNF